MEKGDFVKVQGLQSEAGMKLNGAYGIILGKAMNVVEKKIGTTRYPILLFARRSEEQYDDGAVLSLTPILVDAPKKKIKVDNLAPVMAKSEQEQEALALFRPAAMSHIQSAQEVGDFDKHNKHIHFLIEQCYKLFSSEDGLEICMYHVKVLGMQGKFEQGAKVLQPFLPQVLDEDFEEHFTLPSCYEDVSELYKEFCSTFLRAGDEAYLQDAMDCAMKICGADPPTGCSHIRIKNATAALQAVQGGSYQVLHHDQLKQDPNIAGLLVKACEMVIKIQPRGDKNPELVGKLASANSIAGNYLKASKLHRKALAMENLHLYPDMKEHEEYVLVLSQLQCPGMPLEDVIVLATHGSQATCLKKSDAKSCFMGPPMSPGGPLALLSERGPPKVFYYRLPRDPNDPHVFPAWLLELTKPDNEEEEEESMMVESEAAVQTVEMSAAAAIAVAILAAVAAVTMMAQIVLTKQLGRKKVQIH